MASRGKARLIKYKASNGRKTLALRAHNKNAAARKAELLFPKARLITVSREPSSTGHEYETYIILRRGGPQKYLPKASRPRV